MKTANEVEFRQVSAWEQAVEAAIFPVQLSCPTSRSFSAGLASVDIGGMRLMLVRGADHACSHELPQIRRADDDCYLLTLHLGGSSWFSQDGRSTEVHGGDLIFCDAARPFQGRFSGEFVQLVARIPRDALRYRVGAPGAYTAVRMPTQRGMSRLLAQHMRTVFEEHENFPPCTRSFFASSLIELVTGVFAEMHQARPGARTNQQALYLNRAYAYVADHIRDENLSPECIASALNISVRHLHKVFSETEVTVSQFILEQRLQGCAADLRDAAQAGNQIGMIAYGWGFESTAYFSRVFRQHFGLSARDYRAQHIAQPARRGSGAADTACGALLKST